MNFVTEEKFNDIINNTINSLDELKEKFNTYTNELNDHTNNTAIHSYEKEDYNAINDFIANAERIISASSVFKDQLDKLLDKDTLSSLLTLSNNIETLNQVVANQNIITNYILKHSNPEELKNLKSKQQSLEKLNPAHKYEITKVTEVNKVIEDTNRTYDSNKVIQDEYHRFVTDKQIKDWSNAINILNNLLDKINYTKNTKIVNIQDIPFATTEQGGLMSFDDKRILKEVSDKLNKPLVSWSASDTSSPSYIMNRPDALPANGGNADTINGKSYKEIIKTFNTSIGTSDRCDFIVDNINTIEKYLASIKNRKVCVENNIYDIRHDREIHGLIIDFNDATLEFQNKTHIKFFNCTLTNLNLNSESDNEIMITFSNCKLTNCHSFGNIKITIDDKNIISNSVLLTDTPINVRFNNILSNSRLLNIKMTKESTKNIISNNIMSDLLISGGTSNLISNNIINLFELNAGTGNKIIGNIIDNTYISNVSMTHNYIQ